MFLVKDTSHEREERIKQLSSEDPVLAALLGVIHVEWTVRRAIIALGTSPNVDIRKALERCHGHDKYKDIWKEEVVEGEVTHKRLNEVITNWHGLTRAFNLRHKLVHGVGSCSPDYAIERLRWAIDAAKDIRAYCLNCNINLDERLPIRRRVSTK